jgi:putative ABC transport system permease protein
VRRTILSQAIIVGLLAIFPGIVAGIGVAYLINRATLSVIGHDITFNIHLELIAGASAGAMLTVLAAAWLPAERAARLYLPQALRDG